MSTATRNGAPSPAREAALRACDAGLCVVPPAGPGDREPKRPMGDWKKYQATPSTRLEVEGWYANGRQSLGLVCGAVSGGLELFEFDDREVYEQFRATAARLGINGVVDRIEEGFCEDTPSGGVHWLYRCEELQGNTKLATRPEPTASNPRNVKTLIETRGEGGFVVVAPSTGLHANGKGYILRAGGFDTIATLTADERSTLWALARTFDQSTQAKPDAAESTWKIGIVARSNQWALLPSDDFNTRANWEEVLTGWSKVHASGEIAYWRRPGKDHGWSGTTGFKGADLFHAFSSSTPFDPSKWYSKFSAYATLSHGGDFKAAHQALADRGYGTKGEPKPNRESRATRNVVPGGQPEAEPLSYASLDDSDLGLLAMDEVGEKPIQWLWRYRLAMGNMALLAGDGGIGKSQLMLWLASMISNEGVWPDGSGRAPAGQVLILSAEDRPEDTIKPRLMALGANLSRISLVRAQYRIRREGKEPQVNPVSFQDRAYWSEVLRRLPDCRLFIVDPLPSYLGRGVNDARNSEIRGVIEPFLTEVIEPRDICLLCNTHLNKSVDTRSPVHRIVGSIAYANLPRNVHLVARDPENQERRFFMQVKCNNAPEDLPSIAFRVKRCTVQSRAGQEIEASIPEFEAEPVQVNANQVMGGNQKPGPKPAGSLKAARWLTEQLADGKPHAVRDLIDAAGEAGLLGKQKPDGRWASLNPLYRGREQVPSLPPPLDGLEVMDAEVERGIWASSGPRKFWQLNRAIDVQDHISGTGETRET